MEEKLRSRKTATVIRSFIFVRNCTPLKSFFFFYNAPAPPEIYTFPLPDALPIARRAVASFAASSEIVRNNLVRSRRAHARPRVRPRLSHAARGAARGALRAGREAAHPASVGRRDRKSTRLNSSHLVISYAVFCLT